MTPLTLTLDLAALGASASAVLYCARLHRQLSKLHRLEEGAGRAIRELTAATKASQAASEGIGRTASEEVEKLNAACARLKVQQQSVDDLAGILDGQAASAERRAKQAADAAERSLTVLATRARVELDALEHGVAIACKAVRAIRSEKPSDRPARNEPTTLGADAAPVRQRAAAMANPFLKAVGS
ncbi:hypothetical protein [Parvularcula dongshanensis]|uniref:DsDNA-specific endonuclease/ATPase MutS2 n=1 Tax=Parvularcula dongshanensis TaxID=1173995 RepID=A0A840I0P8_9PROT|nr:hypothetical protein [Parvularcula dongshanensis]MBB4658297.1 dsDNA-specific endonuclease/ATPase MutS2 [Parvularcula dongshanensis]